MSGQTLIKPLRERVTLRQGETRKDVELVGFTRRGRRRFAMLWWPLVGHLDVELGKGRVLGSTGKPLDWTVDEPTLERLRTTERTLQPGYKPEVPG